MTQGVHLILGKAAALLGKLFISAINRRLNIFFPCGMALTLSQTFCKADKREFLTDHALDGIDGSVFFQSIHIHPFFFPQQNQFR